jgi:hypothetical protein
MRQLEGKKCNMIKSLSILGSTFGPWSTSRVKIGMDWVMRRPRRIMLMRIKTIRSLGGQCSV